MNPRENAVRIVRFDQPERIVGALPGLTLAYCGCNHDGFAGGGHDSPVGSRWTDIWGTGWHKEHDGWMGYPEVWPLAQLPAALKTYRWPDPDDERICSTIHRQAMDADRAKGFLIGSHRDTLWEKAYMLLGMKNALCFFLSEPRAMREVLRRIMDFQLAIARHYLDAGVEAVSLSDDLGCQDRLLFSRQIIEEFLIPEYRRLFDLYRSRGVLIQFHSCGHIEPVLDIFMDLGVDVLNPVQATANNLDRVRAVTQGRMALQGGVRSGIVMNGPIEAIRDEVRRRLWQLGREGGYFCCADQALPYPAEHLEAMRAAVREFGAYPLEQG
jgi:uroporphyrinogen decarboxylase